MVGPLREVGGVKTEKYFFALNNKPRPRGRLTKGLQITVDGLTVMTGLTGLTRCRYVGMYVGR